MGEEDRNNRRIENSWYFQINPFGTHRWYWVYKSLLIKNLKDEESTKEDTGVQDYEWQSWEETTKEWNTWNTENT